MHLFIIQTATGNETRGPVDPIPPGARIRFMRDQIEYGKQARAVHTEPLGPRQR